MNKYEITTTLTGLEFMIMILRTVGWASNLSIARSLSSDLKNKSKNLLDLAVGMLALSVVDVEKL